MLDALSEFDNLYIYSEVLQDKVFELMDKAKVAAVSGMPSLFRLLARKELLRIWTIPGEADFKTSGDKQPPGSYSTPQAHCY